MDEWKGRKFATFILTHGRADRVYTYHTLRRCGYTGPIVLLVDDEDEQRDAYLSKYGSDVVVFNKQAAIEATDSMDNLNKRNSVVYARNWAFVIAQELGLDHFWELDDDYMNFGWATTNGNQYASAGAGTQVLDDILDACLRFMETSGAHSVAFAQGGDFIGGANGQFVKMAKTGQFSRKVMNSFLMSTSKPFKFIGRINEDVNTYVTEGRKGALFITVPRLRLWQKATQANAGGLTDIYLDLGTYVKSFYTVIAEPSCCVIREMGALHRRLHHSVSWRHAVPKIVPERVRRASNAQA